MKSIAGSKGLLVVLVLIGVLVLSTGCGSLSQGANSYPTNTISVSGTGQASGEPDNATVMLGVSVSDANVSDAVAKSNATMQAITDAMTALGVEAKDIQTTNFNVWPEDRYDNAGQPTGQRIYHVDSTVQVKVRKLETVGDVIDQGLQAGANNIGGLSFGIEDSDALESDARMKALEDANRKASELAAAMGVSLGDIIIVSESTGGVPPIGYGKVEVAQAAGGGAPPISAGELSVQVDVSVTYRINR
jgi:hypothetical protein